MLFLAREQFLALQATCLQFFILYSNRFNGLINHQLQRSKSFLECFVCTSVCDEQAEDIVNLIDLEPCQ